MGWSPAQPRRARIRWIQRGAVALPTIVILTTPALAGGGPGPSTGEPAELSMLTQGIVAAAMTLVIGGALIALASAYTDRITRLALEQPGRSFLWGFGVSIVFFVVIFVLAITVVGLVVAIPMLIIGTVLAIVLGELGYLATGRIVDDRWTVALPVAIVVAFLVGFVPILGSLVAWIIASIGIGAAVIDYREDGKSQFEQYDSDGDPGVPSDPRSRGRSGTSPLEES